MGVIGLARQVLRMCKLPKGKSDFRELIKNGYVYIDKTKYIEMLENSNDSYVHFLRPRRFAPLVRRAEKVYLLPCLVVIMILP